VEIGKFYQRLLSMTSAAKFRSKIRSQKTGGDIALAVLA
jgi:hypothetical protein